MHSTYNNYRNCFSLVAFSIICNIVNVSRPENTVQNQCMYLISCAVYDYSIRVEVMIKLQSKSTDRQTGLEKKTRFRLWQL